MDVEDDFQDDGRWSLLAAARRAQQSPNGSSRSISHSYGESSPPRSCGLLQAAKLGDIVGALEALEADESLESAGAVVRGPRAAGRWRAWGTKFND